MIMQLVIPTGNPKSLIRLSLGDPTVFGNLDTPDSVVDAVIKQLKNKKNNGYTHSAGMPEARAAIAKKYSTPNAPLTANDIVITSGCSGAVDLAIKVLCNPGDKMLIPSPGFSLYQTIASHFGVRCAQYKLIPEKQFEVDLKHLESLIDDDTKCILINNPGNPTGSNFSKAHILDIIALAEKYCLPIIADEIYANQVFPGQEFHYFGELSKEVPILSLNGLAKQYCVPGWRIGWVAIQDKQDRFKNVRNGLLSLSQLIMGATTPIQAAIPDILFNTDPSFYPTMNSTLAKHALFLYDKLSQVSGLVPIKPQACLYLMVGIDVNKFSDIKSDVDFSEKLLQEEMVFVLPGTCFSIPNFIRLVYVAPFEQLEESAVRFADFCSRHMKK
jgi:tyrosine aminotransferase